MKYYILTASPTFVGADMSRRFRAPDESSASMIAYEVAVEYIEGWEDPDAYTEEHGIEYEYNYHYKEVSAEDYLTKYSDLDEID